MSSVSTVPALNVTHLTVKYHKEIVLSNLSVTVPQGVMVGIIGPNGAGKTTFIKSILGLIPTHAGSVAFFGDSFTKMRHKIAYVAQRMTVDWDFPITVFDMVLMGCYGALGWLKRPGKHEYNRVYEALEKVGLTAVAHRPIGELSGGQQQRAFLARALVQQADLYFLDEPFAAVDMVSEKIIVTLFKDLCAQGKTVIVVHHDVTTALLYFDWVLLLNKTCIAYGLTRAMLQKDMLYKTYGVNIADFWNTMQQQGAAEHD